MFTFLVIISLAGSPCANQEQIRLNQLGFTVSGPKTAVVIAPATWNFTIKSPDLGQTYFQGELSPQTVWTSSGETLKVADFSAFNKEGTFVVHVKGIGSSHPFRITNSVFTDITKGLIRAFYFQRASTNLTSACAGKWSRAAGHDDKAVIVHPSAASDPSKPGARKAGEIYPSPKGWYDAGDYGKYVVNAGITTYQLLLLYECFPDYFKQCNLNIPESNNAIPDILDEIKWELDWLLTMQDPADGGVYHKVTDKNFIGDLAPAAANETRYFIGKGAAATFDFIGILATAYRIYKPFMPTYADSCLKAAKYAWEWGIAHPDSTFRNPSDIVTGEYGDTKTGDEFMWASSELYIATGDTSYYNAGKDKAKSYYVPDWPNVGLLGCYSLSLVKNDSLARSRIITVAETLVKRTQTLPYRTSMSTEFYWGSNGVAANQGMTMLVAYLLTKNTLFLEGAIHACDYLLGRNATGYCFVTGYGSKPSMKPHHRPSTADNIAAPVPGLLVGGPNAQANRSGESCDQVYPKEKAKAYLDHTCSFTTNEVAINWNAPAAFLAGGIEAILHTPSFDLAPFALRFTDTVPPVKPNLAITSVKSDRATVLWNSVDSSVATLTYATSSDFSNSMKHHFSSDDSTSTTITGLTPSTTYHVKVTVADVKGNLSEVTDTFSTLSSSLTTTSTFGSIPAVFASGKPLAISITIPSTDVSGMLSYTVGGSVTTKLLPMTFSGSKLEATLPSEALTENGILVSVKLTSPNDTLLSPVFPLRAETLTVSKKEFTSAYTHKLVSVPGAYSPQTAYPLFKEPLGDTSAWRYFGYSSVNTSYLPNDSIRTAHAGWLYHEKKLDISTKTHPFSPDTLFPVKLNNGWNCISNPFLFPVYWENCMIADGDMLYATGDAASKMHLRRQIFWYNDTSADRIANGIYSTNRHAATHLYNDSTQLYPWNGYWVYAEKENTTLLINPSSVRPSSISLVKRALLTPLSWLITLSLTSEGHASQPLTFGASPEASDNYDHLDTPKPPSAGNLLEASFIHKNWNTASTRFITDIISSQHSPRHEWVLDIQRQNQTSNTTISWNFEKSPDGNVYLFDSAAGTSIDLSSQNSYTLPHGTSKVALIWSATPLNALAAPRTWSVRVHSRKSITINYSIPQSVSRSKPVKLDIYDISGRSVVRMNNINRLPGYYSITWNGCSTSGKVCTSGYYIAKISQEHEFSSSGFRILR